MPSPRLLLLTLLALTTTAAGQNTPPERVPVPPVVPVPATPEPPAVPVPAEAAVPVPAEAAVPAEAETFVSNEPAPIDDEDEDEPNFGDAVPSAPPPPSQQERNLGAEESEDELVVRDGEIVNTPAGAKPKLPPRPPFTLHDYDPEEHTWTVPVDELLTLKSYVQTGYERARMMNSDGGKMKSRSVFDMVEYALNPDGQELDEEEIEFMKLRVDVFKQEQALDVDELMDLNLAFLDRGAPLRFFKNLYIELRERRREHDHLPGRRLLEGGEGRRHLEGLWEHEIGVDQVPAEKGFGGRKFLTRGF